MEKACVTSEVERTCNKATIVTIPQHPVYADQDHRLRGEGRLLAVCDIWGTGAGSTVRGGPRIWFSFSFDFDAKNDRKPNTRYH